MTTMRRLIQPLVLLLIQVAASNGLYIRGADVSSSSPLDDHAAASTRTRRRFLEENELQFCYDALFVADENNDKNVNREEYVSVVQALGGPTVNSYNDLPIVFKSSFSILACRCIEEPDAEPDCCVGAKAKISNNGAAPGDDPTSEDEQNLYHICFLSESSVNKFIADQVPTQTPTESPTKSPRTPAPTVSPTRSPVNKLTAPPTTRAPTAPPTVRPTLAPVVGPTLEPTGPPTRNPTPSPTLAPIPVPTTSPPTKPPTERPTFAPNPFPTTPLPTQAPSVSPTQVPTRSPTRANSGTPTIAATRTPSMAPTTNAPTFSPSVTPTNVPTIPLTDGPTGVPSSGPTFGPTATPSVVPTMTPSISSAPTSSAAPTNIPSVTPTDAPTKTPPDAVVETNYVIAVRGGALLSEYEGDLIESMNILASQVGDDIAGSSRRRRLVSVSVDRPTALAGLDVIDCPDDVESTDRCENVTALVRLFIDDAEDETAAVDQYKEALNESIESGELQKALNFVNADSVVYIVTGRDTGRGIEGEPESTLSAGAITGIVAVGLVGLVLISLLLARGREPREVDLNKQDDHLVDLEGIQPGASNDIMADTSDGEGKPGKKSHKSDESSNAGDSGWSSHGGLSSLDTHSMDEESKNKTMALGGAALASGVIAGAALDQSDNSPSDSSGNLKMTYSELDDAIQKGDWAAVGVTAALLASQSYETGGTSDSHRISLENATLNPSRAAELDRLVEAGDWEGVVAAAAKFDAQEMTHHRDSSGSNSIPSKEGSSSASGASGSVGSSPSNSLGSGSRTHFTVGTAEGTVTTENSQATRKLGEIRKEVEELVRQVVPEEQDNVDEMMLQFQGREEELVETLRSMQERQVVEKSRVEGKKKAKYDIREQVKSNKQELAEKAAEVKDDDEESRRKREQDLKEEQEALAQAAEWEAVAQQARNNASAANDSAAQDAADWAIAQSLNQMSTTNPETEPFGDDDEEGSV